MTVIDQVDESLSRMTVWIVDDDIPIGLAPFDSDDMLLGKRPIDRGSLLSLLSIDWPDPNVKDLCAELVAHVGDVLAFVQPSHAVEMLSRGTSVPDVIIYDLRYQTDQSGQHSSHYLEKLLKKCVSVVQVYTNESTEEATRDLEELHLAYPSRLVTPRQKVETNALELSQLIATRLSESFSAHLAGSLRRLSLLAVEDVLVRLDDLTPDLAVKLLLGHGTTPEELELEFIDLFSEKVGEVLLDSTTLRASFEAYASRLGLADDKAGEAAGEIASVLTSHVKEIIRTDGALLNSLQGIFSRIQAGSSADRSRDEDIVRRFFAFRLFSRPKDDVMRPGDVIRIDESSDLFIVLTPACDLAQFWKKTRGDLALIRIRPIEAGGKEKVRSYGNNLQVSNSVTAQQPLIIPSVPVSDDEFVDHVLFPHESLVIPLEDKNLVGAGGKNQMISKPLRYSDPCLSNNCKRICRISEPFLTGMLEKIRDILFRAGVPNFPDEERERLKRILA